MQKYVLLIMGEPTDWSAVSPEIMKGVMDAYMAYTQRLRDEGRYVDGEGLADESKVIRNDGSSLTVTDGPYLESREILGGYFIFSAENWEEAVAIAKDCPALARPGGVELRRVMDY